MAALIQDAMMLYGDSITQGAWQPGGLAQRLAYAYSRKLDVINRGLSGYNTEWAIPVLNQCFANQHQQQHAQKVRLLTIWFGANDACLPTSPQHVPLPAFKKKLTLMIHTITSPSSPRYSPQTKIILFTPPPINTILRKEYLASLSEPRELDRDFETTRLYAEAVKEVSKKERLSLVDTWGALWKACVQKESSLSEFSDDGLHLNAAGYQVVFDELLKVISRDMPELHYENMRISFPPWADQAQNRFGESASSA